MNQFLEDMIHMTEGEKLVTYWGLYLALFVVVSVLMGIYVWVTGRKP